MGGGRYFLRLDLAVTHNLGGLVNDKVREIFVLTQIGGFCCRPESVSPGLFHDPLLTDAASILRTVCADKHVLQILMTIFLDPVKYLITFHVVFLLFVWAVCFCALSIYQLTFIVKRQCCTNVNW